MLEEQKVLRGLGVIDGAGSAGGTAGAYPGFLKGVIRLFSLSTFLQLVRCIMLTSLVLKCFQFGKLIFTYSELFSSCYHCVNYILPLHK